MAYWQNLWHITVARLRRISTGFPCSACSPQATKPICSSQAKEKATRADFCQCDRLFSHPAFLHPISEMRSGFPHGRYSGFAHLRGHRLPRLYPAFSGFPNDRIAPLRIQTSALTATGIARISTGSLISASGSLGQSKTRDTVQHLIVNKQIPVPRCVQWTTWQKIQIVSSSISIADKRPNFRYKKASFSNMLDHNSDGKCAFTQCRTGRLPFPMRCVWNP